MRIFCFSGTGNSYSVAMDIGAHFSVKPELMTGFGSQSAIEVGDSQIGIISPVYLNDIPQVVKEFVLKLSFTTPNAYTFSVLTSGSGKNRNGFDNINLALAQHNTKLALAYDIFSTSPNVTEIMGMYGMPTQMVGKLKEPAPAPVDEEHNLRLIGASFLTSDPSKKNAVAMHQVKIKGGIDMLAGAYFPSAAPQELVDGHSLHMAVEISNAFRCVM